MKKTFKKFVACLLTVLMVATALPLSVFASDESTTTLPVTTGIAVCNNAKETRVESDGSFNIVNDGSDTNFSIGFWKYDISALKAVGATVTSANVNVNVNRQQLNNVSSQIEKSVNKIKGFKTKDFFAPITNGAKTLEKGLSSVRGSVNSLSNSFSDGESCNLVVSL